MSETVTTHSKRDALRFPGFERSINVRSDYEDGTARLVNISTGGCAIDEVSIELEVKQKVLISLYLDNMVKPVQIQALVTRDEPDRIGLQFLHMHEKLKQQIIRFFAHENRRRKSEIEEPPGS